MKEAATWSIDDHYLPRQLAIYQARTATSSRPFTNHLPLTGIFNTGASSLSPHTLSHKGSPLTGLNESSPPYEYPIFMDKPIIARTQPVQGIDDPKANSSWYEM